MYECIEIPELTTSATLTTTTTAKASTTIHGTSTSNYSSTSSSDPNSNWRDGMDQNDLKVLKTLSIFELVIALILQGRGYEKVVEILADFYQT